MHFNGISVPGGEGLVLEVHFDLIKPSADFLAKLKGDGFEDDPFSVFYPPEYTHHFTGRLRVPRTDLGQVIAEVRFFVSSVVQSPRALDKFYAEIELVRAIRHFGAESLDAKLSGQLDGFWFASHLIGHQAVQADVHVEFAAGTVSPEVRQYLEDHEFYWVATPQTQYFGPEEIATLQTETYGAALQVFEALCQNPLPQCTGIHLEQKLVMAASRRELRMPRVISVGRT